MRTGDFCVVPPGVEHSISVFDDSIIINLMLRRNTLHGMFYNFLNTPNKLSAFFLNNIYARRANDYILFHSGMDSQIRESFLWMLWESLNRQEYYYQCITNVLPLDFYLLVRNYSESIQMPLFNSRMDVQRYAILQYIQDNYRDITLAAVANIAEVIGYDTTEHYIRQFKKHTGITPSAFRKQETRHQIP